MGERAQQARVAWPQGLPQPPKDDAAIGGRVRFLETEGSPPSHYGLGRPQGPALSSRVSGGRSACPPFAPSAAALAGLGHSCPAGGLSPPSTWRRAGRPERPAAGVNPRTLRGNPDAGGVERRHRAQGRGAWVTGPGPPRAAGLSTAAGMFAANLTPGAVRVFCPKSLAPNSTVGLELAALAGTEQPLATPTSYLTLVPLLATMLFIMGRVPGEGWGRASVMFGWAGALPFGGWEGSPSCSRETPKPPSGP